MSPEIIVAAVALGGIITYAVLAGADFGGGIWDLFASGPRRNQQRAAIEQAMGPVWEANHVWLIFVIVLLFTAFPVGFAALGVGLFIPFNLALLGIILRGASFVFRAYSPHRSQSVAPSPMARRWGVIFGVASAMMPLLLGMSLGAVSAGGLRIVGGQVVISGIPPWLTPLALMTGMLALALCTYLAATYLANETTGRLREDFRGRALLAGTAMAGLSLMLLPLLALGAPHLWQGLLRPQALPAVLLGVAAALVSGWALLRRRYRLARISAIIQVVCLLAGWGLAQYPYLIYPDLTLSAAAGSEATLRFVLFSLPLGLVLLLPSLWLLFKVFKGNGLSASKQ